MGWIALIADAAMAYGELVAPLIVAGRRHLDVLPGGAELGRRARSRPEAIGKAAGHQQHDARARRRVRHRARAWRCSPAPAATPRPQAFSDGFVAAIGISAALSLLAALAGRRCRAGVAAPSAAPPGRPAFESEGGA